METTKPIVQVILPRHGPSEDQQELSRPPSAFPVAEIDRLRAQEGGNDESSGRSTPSQPGDHSSQDPAPAPPQYDDPIPYHPKPSVDLPPYEPLPDTFQPPPEKSAQKAGLSLVGSASGVATDEKRRLDLEAVTSAVDHAYTAAPQFDDQRSEMRPSGSRSATMVNEGTAIGRKMSLKDEKELNKLFDQIERAHGHSKCGILSLRSKEMLTLGKPFSELPDQSTELDADRAAERTTRKRESFYQDLLSSTSAGRMHDQEYDLANASPRVSPLVKTFAESGSCIQGEDPDESDGKRKSREVVDIHQAIRDGPGQL